MGVTMCCFLKILLASFKSPRWFYWSNSTRTDMNSQHATFILIFESKIQLVFLGLTNMLIPPGECVTIMNLYLSVFPLFFPVFSQSPSLSPRSSQKCLSSWSWSRACGNTPKSSPIRCVCVGLCVCFHLPSEIFLSHICTCGRWGWQVVPQEGRRGVGADPFGWPWWEKGQGHTHTHARAQSWCRGTTEVAGQLKGGRSVFTPPDRFGPSQRGLAFPHTLAKTHTDRENVNSFEIPTPKHTHTRTRTHPNTHRATVFLVPAAP